MKKMFAALLTALLLSGCGETVIGFDKAMFSIFGKTVFSGAEEVSIKEVHFDHAVLDDKNVIVEGKVASVGEYNTYAVVVDSTARVLVVQTQIASFDERIKEEDVGKKFKILGKLVIRKKGLPTIEAHSVLGI
jgi:hypothetical protein